MTKNQSKKEKKNFARAEGAELCCRKQLRAVVALRIVNSLGFGLQPKDSSFFALRD